MPNVITCRCGDALAVWAVTITVPGEGHAVEWACARCASIMHGERVPLNPYA